LQVNNVEFGYVIGTLEFELDLGYIYLTTASDGIHTQKIECGGHEAGMGFRAVGPRPGKPR
jgi:hypothetical protein